VGTQSSDTEHRDSEATQRTRLTEDRG